MTWPLKGKRVRRQLLQFLKSYPDSSLYDIRKTLSSNTKALHTGLFELTREGKILSVTTSKEVGRAKISTGQRKTHTIRKFRLA